MQGAFSAFRLLEAETRLLEAETRLLEEKKRWLVFLDSLHEDAIEKMADLQGKITQLEQRIHAEDTAEGASVSALRMVSGLVVCVAQVAGVGILMAMEDCSRCQRAALSAETWPCFVEEVVHGFLLPLVDMGLLYADLRPGLSNVIMKEGHFQVVDMESLMCAPTSRDHRYPPRGCSGVAYVFAQCLLVLYQAHSGSKVEDEMWSNGSPLYDWIQNQVPDLNPSCVESMQDLSDPEIRKNLSALLKFKWRRGRSAQLTAPASDRRTKATRIPWVSLRLAPEFHTMGFYIHTHTHICTQTDVSHVDCAQSHVFPFARWRFRAYSPCCSSLATHITRRKVGRASLASTPMHTRNA